MPDREKVVKGLTELKKYLPSTMWGPINDALTILQKHDAVVHCRDCEYVCMCKTTDIFPDMPVYAKCTLTDEVHEPDWFCADGERRTDDG